MILFNSLEFETKLSSLQYEQHAKTRKIETYHAPRFRRLNTQPFIAFQCAPFFLLLKPL